MFGLFKNKEKEAFLQLYPREAWDTMEKIWEAKKNNATELDIYERSRKIDSKTKALNINLYPLYNFDALKDLTNLQVLKIGGGGGDLISLRNLVNLRVLKFGLIVSPNFDILKNFINLQEFHLEYGNGKDIVDFTPFRYLTNLKRLHIPLAKINDLSPLKDLTNLEYIDFSGCKIDNIAHLSKLNNLRFLNLGGVEGISDFSPIGNLQKLEHLILYNTKISDLTPLKDLVNLKLLTLNNTTVADLSPLKKLIEKGTKVKWYSDEKAEGIYIEDTPLSNPPLEIVKQGNETILRYWKEQERKGSVNLKEARLLIVGQGGAGKTTLRKKLINCHSDLPNAKDTTRGIEVETLFFPTENGDFGLHIWDFGGQNIQHYAHQFFLSDSVVYALVHSEREQNDHTSYWLNIIELLGKNSPILLIQNEKFGHSDDLKNMAAIRERFPNVRKPIKLDLSLAKDSNYIPFKNLHNEICHLATQLPHVGKEYLRSFNDVREQLKILSQDQHSISWEKFETLCSSTGITDTELMCDYARYFHQLGIALWFEEDEMLDQYVFLRPKWIIDALFELLYEGESLRQKLIINIKDVRNIWQGEQYKGMHGNLLRLMKNFEMCYEIVGDTPQYIVPQLLPVDRAEYKPSVQATQVVFQYKFLPKGFLTRLTCRLHRRIEDKNVWNDAVKFTDGDSNIVFAKEAYAQNTIILISEGNHKRQLLNEVVNTLKDINTSSKFENLQWDIQVKCPCSMCLKSERAYLFDYEYLRKKLLKGQIKAECQKSLDDVLIKDILREVDAFSFKQIKDLIANGHLQEAVNLLRGRFPDLNDLILVHSQISHLDLSEIRGLILRRESNIEYQRLSEQVLKLVGILEREVKD